MSELGIYHSDLPTPSLAECMDAARWRIQRQYEGRVEKWSGINFVDYWNGICDWLKGERNNASRLESLVDLPPIPAPEPYDALSAAVAFWVESACARDAGDTNRAWAALLQSHHYLGVASGPESGIERRSHGGRAQSEAFSGLRASLIEWLGELEEQSCRSVQVAIETIGVRVDAFRPEQPESSGRKAGRGRSRVPNRLFRDWSTSDPEVRAAFERVVAGGIKPGRKKSSTNT